MIDKPRKLPAAGWRYAFKSWRRRLFDQKYVAPVLCVIATGGIMAFRGMGAFQVWELHALDWIMNQRLAEQPDGRIVIIGINEQDVMAYGNAAISDQLLADVLKVVKAQNPTVIGMDLFRNASRDEGYSELEKIFDETPNLIGIEKVVNDRALESVAGNSVLMRKGQVAASDLIVDVDGRVRRGFLFPSASGDRVIESLSFRVALEYLGSHNIEPKGSQDVLELGAARLPPFEANAGGYNKADAGGYQLIMNWRANLSFDIFSARDVLSGRLPPDALQDKIVMIGTMQSGDADVFFTPYSTQKGLPGLLPSYGVEIHASLASQIVSAAFGERSFIKTLPEAAEIILIAVSAGVGVMVYRLGRNDLFRLVWFGLTTAAIGGISYLALMVSGWWLPVVPVVLSLFAAPLITRLQNINRLQTLSQVDELTQLANRRSFQEHLAQEWQRAMRSHTSLSLILCDVDYFKLYNDTYGHPQGDECLRQVAYAIGQAARRPDDMAARYGGEEFVILLPNTTCEGAQQIARDAAANVQALKLEHKSSKVLPFVTISLGVTTLVPKPDVAMSTLVDTADLGLYEAKRRGRNQMTVRLPWTVG